MGLVWYVMPEIWKMEGDQSFARELAAIYVGSGDSLLAELAEAADCSDWVTVGARARTLKGASANKYKSQPDCRCGLTAGSGCQGR